MSFCPGSNIYLYTVGFVYALNEYFRANLSWL